VEENQAAVDERAEVGLPAHAQFVGSDIALAREADREGVGLLGHRKEVVRAREVDDLAVVGGRLLRHGSS